MNFTKEQIEEQMHRIAAWDYKVSQVRLAARTNNQWSEHHPDHIRRRISQDRALLREALN
mgnify:CR=1 FL=1